MNRDTLSERLARAEATAGFLDIEADVLVEECLYWKNKALELQKALQHEVKRSRRHLAASTIALLEEMK